MKTYTDTDRQNIAILREFMQELYNSGRLCRGCLSPETLPRMFEPGELSGNC